MIWAKLVADIDGGAGSEAVVGAALQIGQAFAARVKLLHIERGDLRIGACDGRRCGLLFWQVIIFTNLGH